MTAPAKPTIDECIADSEADVMLFAQIPEAEKQLAIATANLDFLRAHKAIMEAERPEPVAWMQSDHLHKLIARHCGSQSMFARCSDHQLQLDYKPLYGPDLLAYADRMREERDDALKATCCDAKEKNEGCYRAVTAERQLADCRKECKEQARLNGMGSEREAKLMAQLAELQAKYDGLVARLREPSEEMISEGKLAAAKTSDVVSVMRTMSAVALREGEE